MQGLRALRELFLLLGDYSPIWICFYHLDFFFFWQSLSSLFRSVLRSILRSVLCWERRRGRGQRRQLLAAYVRRRSTGYRWIKPPFSWKNRLGNQVYRGLPLSESMMNFFFSTDNLYSQSRPSVRLFAAYETPSWVDTKPTIKWCILNPEGRGGRHRETTPRLRFWTSTSHALGIFCPLISRCCKSSSTCKKCEINEKLVDGDVNDVQVQLNVSSQTGQEFC
jgi:hypothetical protein